MRIILYLFLFILLFTYAYQQIYDGDIGHHLKAGEWMLAHGKILDRDIFSYTAFGKVWLNHSWLAEIILYIVYVFSGINGLIFFKIFILFLSYFFLIKAGLLLANKGEVMGDFIIAILFIMSVVSASARFMVRPLIFTFLGVAISIYLFSKAKKNINYLFIMPLVLIFWVNLHAEFMLGIIMVAIFWLYTMTGFLIKRISKKGDNCDSKYYLKTSLVLGLSLAALLINPYGLKLFIHPVQLTTSDLFMTSISEWLPPMHPIFRQEKFVVYFYWFLGIGLLSFLLNFKKKDSIFFLFFIIFGLMSLSAIRFMPYLTMIGLPVVAQNLNDLKEKIFKRITPGRLLIVIPRLAVIGLMVWMAFLIEGRTHYTEFGLGLAEKVCYPLRAGEFLEQAKIKGNMFNMCDFGGYLIWRFGRDRPVFVDGRLDVYGEQIYRDFLEPTEEVFQKYNINYIFLSFRHPFTRGLLYQNKNWPLIYWDDTSLIYIKNSKENKDLIDSWAYHYLHPLTGSLDFLKKAGLKEKASIWKEMHRALRNSPNSIRAHVVLGDLYVELNEDREAIQAYEAAVQLGERYHTEYMVKVYHNLGKLYHNLGDYLKAERYYQKVIKMSSPGKSAYNQALEDWGQLAYRQGEKKKAFKLIKEAVRYKSKDKMSLLSDYPISLAKLALLYEDLGKKEKAVMAWKEVYEIGGKECRKQANEHLNKLAGTL